jgi:hypothetical protein
MKINAVWSGRVFPPVIEDPGGMQYVLSLFLDQYHKLKKLNRIAATEHGLIVNARYDPELGLLVDEPDHGDSLVRKK